MSIDYFGIPFRDHSTLGLFIEGDGGDAPALDAAALRAELRNCGLEGNDGGQMGWRGAGDNIFVHVGRCHVEVNHNSGGDEQYLVVLRIIVTLQKHGLHVWHNGLGDWLPKFESSNGDPASKGGSEPS